MGIKKKVLLFFFCLFFFPCAISKAQATYTITEVELTQLDKNLAVLKTHSIEKERLLQRQKEALELAKKELQEAQKELQKVNAKMKNLEALNEETQNSLHSANKYLEEYAKEEKERHKRLKIERNIAVLLAIFALCR